MLRMVAPRWSSEPAFFRKSPRIPHISCRPRLRYFSYPSSIPEGSGVMENTATLLLYCQDRQGLVFAIAGFILVHRGNILHADQHQDALQGLFFMRIQWSLTDFDLDQESFARSFAPLVAKYGFTWQLVMGEKRPSVAIFVSRYQHCLIDLLYRHQGGELPCHLAMVIS